MSERIIELHSLDGVKINGYLMSGDRNNKNVLIEIHGMTSNCFKKRERVIAKTLKNVGIDTICINTRGSEIVKYIKYNDGRRELAGTAYEDIEESYYDLMEVINAIMNIKGYNIEEVNQVMRDKENRKGAFNNKIYLEYVDEEKRNLKEEMELNKNFRK